MLGQVAQRIRVDDRARYALVVYFSTAVFACLFCYNAPWLLVLV